MTFFKEYCLKLLWRSDVELVANFLIDVLFYKCNLPSLTPTTKSLHSRLHL